MITTDELNNYIYRRSGANFFLPFLYFQDADLSRNMPGKVKVSAPNLQKIKKK